MSYALHHNGRQVGRSWHSRETAMLDAQKTGAVLRIAAANYIHGNRQENNVLADGYAIREVEG